MKSIKKTTVILLFALIVSTFATGCAGCGTDTTQNKEDMVESIPATDESIVENNNANNTQTLPSNEASDSNGGNSTADQITEDPNAVMDNNADHSTETGNTPNENGITSDDNGNLVGDAGNAVGDAMDNVGNAVEDVVDGVGNGVRDITN